MYQEIKNQVLIKKRVGIILKKQVPVMKTT